MVRPHSTVNVDHDRHEMARAAVRLVARQTGREYPLAQFVRDAFDAQLKLIWDEYNEGRPIRPDATRLPTRPEADRPAAPGETSATPSGAKGDDPR
ncbi:hypothetical protein E3G68_005072 [Mycobacteroides abscessus]|nr:hypothetical protein [Mycobacteroides abscessus]